MNALLAYAHKYRLVLGIALVLFGLYLTSLYSYLLFHSLVELFSVVVAFTIFVLAWNTQHFLSHGYWLFIGFAYLFVGVLDLLHTLAYQGMGVFPLDDGGGGANLPTQLWIAARYLQSLSLLVAPVFLRRRFHPWLGWIGFGAVTVLLLLSIFYWGIFPDSYLEGVGLTPFKRASEYVIALIFLGAFGLLLKYRAAFSPDVRRWLGLSILVSVAAELAFSDYASVYGFTNLLGHLLKLLAFYLIYIAIVETGFNRPFELLFRDLKQREEALHSLAQFPNENPNPVLRVSASGEVLYTNRAGEHCLYAWERQTGLRLPQDLRQTLQDVLDARTRREVELEIAGQVYIFTLAPIPDSQYVNLYGRDITERKRHENQAQFLADVGETLVRTNDPNEAIAMTISGLRDHLKADYAAFAEIDPGRSQATIYYKFPPSGPPVAAEVPLSVFPPPLLADHRSGQTLAITDTQADPRTAAVDAIAFAPLEVRAFIAAPYMREGEWIATLTVASRSPRLWRPDEISLLHSVADRLWLAVENARLIQDLRESEQRYRTMGESIPFGVWLCGPDGGARYFSQSFLDLLQIPLEAARQFGWIGRLPAEDREPALERWMECVRTGADWEAEYRVQGPDRQIYTILSRGRPVRDENGRITSWVGINLDITERNRIELALQESEERLRLAAEAADMGTWRWELLRDELTWNDKCRALFGLPSGASISYPVFLDALHPEDRARTDRAVYDALNHGEDLDIEYRTVWPDGSTHWILSKGRVFFDPAGIPIRMIGIVMEVTQRKQAEESMRHGAARDQALASISKTMAEADLEDRLVFEEVARTVAQVIGNLCLIRILSPDRQWLQTMVVYHDNPEALALMKEILEAHPQRPDESFSGRVITSGEAILLPVVTPRQIRAMVKTEFQPWIERYGLHSAVAAPMRSPGGVMGVVLLIRDQPGRPFGAEDLSFVQEIADRIALAMTNARLYQEAQHELSLRRKADAALQSYAHQLARSNRELQDFAFIASHDLQEPLRKIRTFGDRLIAGHSAALGTEALDYLNRMQSAANRMQYMLDDLLAYSRVTTQAQPSVPVDLQQVAREVLSDLEVRIEETGGKVILSYLPVIEADPRQMQQLLQNLIGNALKFHRPGVEPVVKVCTQDIPAAESPDGEMKRILVEDNGIGFDEKYLERIFQPFQRLHGQSEYPGSGMGLAICQKIVERHHGTLTARSSPGQGSAFIVTLPARQT